MELGGFKALARGPAKPGSPTLVWLHGFPDHPPTAEPLFAELESRFRVIAPWLRGYAPSPLEGPYDLETLARDVIGMLVELDQPVDLVGHDWGAVITYAVCALAPERVRRAVTLAVPHPLTMMRALRTPAQLRRSWYMMLFQLPGASRLVRARGLALVDRLWRTWSPDFRLDATRREDLHACLAASLPAPIEYYRAMRRTRPRETLRLFAKPIATPLLQLHGANDGCILPPRRPDDDARRFVTRRLEIIDGAGHFLHLEQPVAVAARIIDWLA
ncbi:MAG TPA: alpha/beta hydrolase [Kofleriaceae bacterium]